MYSLPSGYERAKILLEGSGQGFLSWDLEEGGRSGEHSRQWVLAQEERGSRENGTKGGQGSRGIVSEGA